jgi:hypothetical protein
MSVRCQRAPNVARGGAHVWPTAGARALAVGRVTTALRRRAPQTHRATSAAASPTASAARAAAAAASQDGPEARASGRRALVPRPAQHARHALSMCTAAWRPARASRRLPARRASRRHAPPTARFMAGASSLRTSTQELVSVTAAGEALTAVQGAARRTALCAATATTMASVCAIPGGPARRANCPHALGMRRRFISSSGRHCRKKGIAASRDHPPSRRPRSRPQPCAWGAVRLRGAGSMACATWSGACACARVAGPGPTALARRARATAMAEAHVPVASACATLTTPGEPARKAWRARVAAATMECAMS